MGQDKSTSNQRHPGPGLTRNTNTEKSNPVAAGQPSLQRQAAAISLPRQRPVTSASKGFSNGISNEPRSNKRPFVALDEERNSHGSDNKRVRTTVQRSDSARPNPRNDKILKEPNPRFRNWLDEAEESSIKDDGAVDAPRVHGDFSHPAQHTISKPAAPVMQPRERSPIKAAIKQALDPDYLRPNMEKIRTDLISINETVGPRAPNEESIRTVVDSINKTLNLVKEKLDKQQTEAKVNEGFEAIKKKLNELGTNECAVLAKMSTCETAIAIIGSEIDSNLASFSEKLDRTKSEVESMKHVIFDAKPTGDTIQKSLVRFEKEFDGWKKEVVESLKRKETDRDPVQRLRDLKSRLAVVVEKNAAEAVKDALTQLKRSVDDGTSKSILMLQSQTEIHRNECVAKNVEIEKLRAEVFRLARENQELEKKNQAGVNTIAALQLERDSASSEAKTAAEGAETLRRQVGALEEERSQWKDAATKAREESEVRKSNSALNSKLVEALEKVEAGLRQDFAATNALRKTAEAKLLDIDVTIGVETTIKALMEKDQQVEKDRHDELLKAVKDNALAQRESWRERQRSNSTKMADCEVFDKVLESPWAGSATRTIRNLAKFDVVHERGSRESLSHTVVYRNIVPYISGRGCTQAFEAFLGYSQPGHEYCLFAVLEKQAGEAGEAVGEILSGDCPDHEDRDDCLVTRCRASADGQGKTYIFLNPLAS